MRLSPVKWEEPVLLDKMAEGERFELSDGLTHRWFSRPVHSTALPPLRRADGTISDSLLVVKQSVH